MDEVIRVTRCQPSLVQLVGQKVVERLNTERRRRQGDRHTVTNANVAEVLEEIPVAGRPYLADLWAELGPDDKCVLRPLAAAPQCGLEQLVLGSGMAEANVRQALTSLEQARLVEPYTKGLRVQVELTRLSLAELARRGALAPASG